MLDDRVHLPPKDMDWGVPEGRREVSADLPAQLFRGQGAQRFDLKDHLPVAHVARVDVEDGAVEALGEEAAYAVAQREGVRGVQRILFAVAAPALDDDARRGEIRGVGVRGHCRRSPRVLRVEARPGVGVRRVGVAFLLLLLLRLGLERSQPCRELLHRVVRILEHAPELLLVRVELLVDVRRQLLDSLLLHRGLSLQRGPRLGRLVAEVRAKGPDLRRDLAEHVHERGVDNAGGVRRRRSGRGVGGSRRGAEDGSTGSWRFQPSACSYAVSRVHGSSFSHGSVDGVETQMPPTGPVGEDVSTGGDATSVGGTSASVVSTLSAAEGPSG